MSLCRPGWCLAGIVKLLSFRFTRRLRMVAKTLASRSIEVTYETVHQWPQRFVQQVVRHIRHRSSAFGNSDLVAYTLRICKTIPRLQLFAVLLKPNIGSGPRNIYNNMKLEKFRIFTRISVPSTLYGLGLTTMPSRR